MRHGESGERVEIHAVAQHSSRMLVGSFKLPLDGTDCMEPIVSDGSDHLLGLGQDKILSACSPLAMTFEENSLVTFDSLGTGEDQRAPARAQGDNMFVISLSAGPVPAICPPATAGEACTPCTQALRTSVDELCNQLRQAITPIIERIPNREPIAPKRRPRQKRQPISDPRRSVRIVRGVGHGSATSKQQHVLIRKLCLANEGQVISDDALQAYVQIFDKPLVD